MATSSSTKRHGTPQTIDINVELPKGFMGGCEKADDKKPTRFQNLLEEEKKSKFTHATANQVAPAIELDAAITPVRLGLIGYILIFLSWFTFLVLFPFSLLFSIKVVRNYEKAVVFRLGRLRKGGDQGPGVIFILPCIDSYSNIDMRTISFHTKPQDILTFDSVLMTVEIVVYYRVSNATISVTKVGNAYSSTSLLAQTTIRNVIATKTLSDIVHNRVFICNDIKVALSEVTATWGINIERIEIKNLSLPEPLQKALTAEAEAATEAKAKLTIAEGEKTASLALLKASEIIGKSPTALQLRYLQTLSKIAAQRNSTIVFPVPIDVMPILPGMSK